MSSLAALCLTYGILFSTQNSSIPEQSKQAPVYPIVQQQKPSKHQKNKFEQPAKKRNLKQPRRGF